MNYHSIVDWAIGRYDRCLRCNRVAVRRSNFDRVSVFDCDHACARKDFAAGSDEHSAEAIQKVQWMKLRLLRKT